MIQAINYIKTGFSAEDAKKLDAVIKPLFDKGEKIAKLPHGPASDNPGPILLNVATMGAKLVVISKPSKETINKDMI